MKCLLVLLELIIGIIYSIFCLDVLETVKVLSAVVFILATLVVVALT